MLNGNICHLVNSLLPPTGTLEHDFLRLEYLSACGCLRNDNLSTILLKTPRRLYAPLFQACICDFFHEINEKNLKKNLSTLLNHWPYETLILKNIMPSLPPQIEKFYHYNNRSSGPLQMVLSDLQKIYDKIVDILRQEFLQMTEELFKDGTSCRTLKHIDISNLKSAVNPVYLLNALKVIGIVNSINSTKKIELICDVWIHCWEEKSLQALNEIVNLSSKPGSCIAIYFKKAELYKYPPHSHLVEPLFRALNKSGTEYIEGDGSSDTNGMSTFRIKLDHLYGLAVPNQCLSFYNIFLNKDELKELNFSYNNLRGALGPISRLSEGLQYLNLSTCNLNLSDLDVLAKSHHVRSLQQLNLSHNNFSFDSAKPNELIVLIRSLSAVELLELEECQLHTWSVDMIKLLTTTMNKLDKLAILNVKHKQLTTSQLSSMFLLGKSDPLKYLSIYLPNEALAAMTNENGVIDKGLVQNACKEIRNCINESRNVSLHVAVEYYL